MDVAEQERVEKARADREEQERLREEEKARLQAELDARILKETEENRGFYEERSRRLSAERDGSLGQKDWERYVTCGPLPDALSEAAVNENLSEWRDKPVGALELTMADCELAHQLLAEMRGETLSALELGLEGQAEWQQRLSAELRARQFTRLALLRSRALPQPSGEGHTSPLAHRWPTAAPSLPHPLPHYCPTAGPPLAHHCPTAAPPLPHC